MGDRREVTLEQARTFVENSDMIGEPFFGKYRPVTTSGTTGTSLRVCLRTAAGADRERVWQAVHKEVARVLAAHKLGHFVIEHADEPPGQSPGGKYRTIVPLKNQHDLN